MAPLFDLLHSETYLELLASPSRLEQRIPRSHRGWVVIEREGGSDPAADVAAGVEFLRRLL